MSGSQLTEIACTDTDLHGYPVCTLTCVDGYNKYVELLGGAIGAGACAALRQGNKVYTIADDIPLLHFLSGRIMIGISPQWH